MITESYSRSWLRSDFCAIMIAFIWQNTVFSLLHLFGLCCLLFFHRTYCFHSQGTVLAKGGIFMLPADNPRGSDFSSCNFLCNKWCRYHHVCLVLSFFLSFSWLWSLLELVRFKVWQGSGRASREEKNLGRDPWEAGGGKNSHLHAAEDFHQNPRHLPVWIWVSIPSTWTWYSPVVPSEFSLLCDVIFTSIFFFIFFFFPRNSCQNQH